jgi:polyisoprenoid-binding protein YceI
MASLLVRALLLLPFVVLLSAVTYQGRPLPESFVEYRASDGHNRWSGRAPINSLQLNFDDDNLMGARLVVVVEPGQFDSGNFILDAQARRVVFNTARYPTITFTATSISADPDNLPSGATRELVIRGTLAMHGVERSLAVPVTVSRSGNSFSASGEFRVLLSDFGMTRPRFFHLIVDDLVEVAFSVQGELTLGP